MTFYEFVDGATNLVPLCLLIGLGLSFYYFRRLDKIYKLLVLYLVLSLIADILSRTLAYIEANNLLIVLLFGFFELLFFTLLYFSALLHKPTYIMWILIITGLVYMLWEMLSLPFMEINLFQSYVRVVDAFLIVLLSLVFFSERVRWFEHPEWPLFRLNTAILAYFSVGFIFFLPMNFLINQRSDTKMIFWLVYIFMTLFFYVFLICEICINGLSRKRLPSG
jgi:hypothetical protein